ncbi:MAG: efflux RND transporter periplasmic adaptor subunit [Vicinamibacterales bacterium]
MTARHRLRRPAAGPLVAAALAAVLAALLAAGCGGSSPAPAEEQPAASDGTVALTDDAMRAAGIETATARVVERDDRLEAPGVVTFDERRTARIGSIVDGVVVDVSAQPGDHVPAGARLGALHSHQVHDAWAAYFTALAAVRDAESSVSYARVAAERAGRLVADKALSVQEAARARAEAVTADERLAAARAEVTRTEQELEHYGIQADPGANPTAHEQVPVTTPVGGSVIERLVSTGTAVTPGTPLFVVSDLSRVWVTAEIDEPLLGRVAVGRPADVRVAAYGDEVFPGTVGAIGDVIDPITRRGTVRVELDNPGRRLKPQMYARVALGTSAPRNRLVVPGRALQALDGETIVFVQAEPGRFVRRAVTTGATTGDEVEIVRGLSEGDVVATAGAFLLKSELAGPAAEEP